MNAKESILSKIKKTLPGLKSPTISPLAIPGWISIQSVIKEDYFWETIEKLKKIGFQEVEVFITGIGSGRESAVRSLASHGLNIVSVKDITPAPHNGPRPKKIRRV